MIDVSVSARRILNKPLSVGKMSVIRRALNCYIDYGMLVMED